LLLFPGPKLPANAGETGIASAAMARALASHLFLVK
jgi:hypothetical protein